MPSKAMQNAPRGEKPDYGKPRWREAYNCHSLSLAKGAVSISVNWGSHRGENFVVSAMGIRLLKRFEHLDEGKAAGIALARRLMNAAESELVALEKETPDVR